MKLFTKNSPEGFAIYRLTCASQILPQRIINQCLVTMARLFSPGPEGIDDIIIQVNGDSGLTPGLYHCTPLTLAKIVFLCDRNRDSRSLVAHADYMSFASTGKY